jgi:hypothetical protein
VAKFMAVIVANLIAHKAAAKFELLVNKTSHNIYFLNTKASTEVD